MMKRRLLYIALLLLLLPFWAVWSQETISSIEVNGLKRTREDTLSHIIKVKVGDPITEELTTSVEQRLRKAKIFQEEISVEIISGDGYNTLKIDLKDRWTLVGLPFFAYVDGDTSAGAILFDSNLMGKRQIMVATAIYSGDDGITSFFLFKDPTFLNSNNSGSVALTAGNPRVTLTDLSGEIVWEDYIKEGLSLSLRGGKQFSDYLTLESSVNGAFFSDVRGETLPPREGETYANLGLTIKTAYDSRYIFPLFSQGGEGTLEASTMWEPEGNLSLFSKGKYSYSRVIHEVFLLKASFEGAVTNDPFHSLYLLGGATGSRSLPSKSIASDMYLNGEIRGETRIIKLGFGSVTLPLFWESGWLSDYRDESQLYHGAGVGMRFYLDKVAFPAMGMDYVHNFTTDYNGFSFTIGMAY